MTAFSVTVEGAIDSYDKLLEALTSHTDGMVSGDERASFVREAEGLIRAALMQNPVRPMFARDSVVISDEYVPLPTDFLSLRFLEVADTDGALKRLSYVDPIHLGQIADEDHFTIDGTDLRFHPASGLTGTLFYVADFTPIDASNQSNWILDRHPSVYFRGALACAYSWLRDKNAQDESLGQFSQALDLLVASYPKPVSELSLKVDPALSWTSCQRLV